MTKKTIERGKSRGGHPRTFFGDRFLLADAGLQERGTVLASSRFGWLEVCRESVECVTPRRGEPEEDMWKNKKKNKKKKMKKK